MLLPVVIHERVFQNFIRTALNESVHTFWEHYTGVSQLVAEDTQVCFLITARSAM